MGIGFDMDKCSNRIGSLPTEGSPKLGFQRFRNDEISIYNIQKAKDGCCKEGYAEPYCPNTPPSTGHKINPRPKAAPSNPKFWAFFCGVLISAIYAAATVWLAPVTPATSRPINNQRMDGANPVKM